MKTIRFHKSECGVDLLLNVLNEREYLQKNYSETAVYNTDCFEILFFKKAKGTLILNQRRLDITDNTIVFISAFQKRQWKMEGGQNEFTILVFQEEFLNDFFADKIFVSRLLYFYQLAYPLVLPVSAEKTDKFHQLLSEIKTELVVPKPDSAHIIRSLLYYLLQTLNREYAQQNDLPLNKAANNHAYQFKKLLELHIKEKQRISDYTELLNISRISLNKAVKAQFDVTATDLLKQRLIFEIKNYLIHSNKTIAEIAYELNFSEPNHLMRLFKTQTGQTTGEFIAGFQNGSR